jgi:predicted small metal-binding protein
MLKEVTCDCGWRCQGSDDEIIAQVQRHGLEAHGVETTPEQVMAIARELHESEPPDA